MHAYVRFSQDGPAARAQPALSREARDRALCGDARHYRDDRIIIPQG
jgi:hypothetical protein